MDMMMGVIMYVIFLIMGVVMVGMISEMMDDGWMSDIMDRVIEVITAEMINVVTEEVMVVVMY